LAGKKPGLSREASSASIKRTTSHEPETFKVLLAEVPLVVVSCINLLKVPSIRLLNVNKKNV
jgi:hypothetical protein